MTTDPTPLQERIRRARSVPAAWAKLRDGEATMEQIERHQERMDGQTTALIAAEVRSARAMALRAEALDISFIEIEDDYDRLDYSTSREFYEDMVRDHLRARATDIEQED